MNMLPFTALALAMACAAPVTALTVEQIWRTDGLASPESVARADDGTLYVSNINGEPDAKDGNGFIAHLGSDGRILQREWVTGLDGPKGLTIVGGTLYAADIDQLDEIDIASGRLVARHAAPGAQFLNDTAALADGTILISDSATQRIYAWQGGRMQVWLEHPLLRSVNGLLPDHGRLIVVTMEGLLLSIDLHTRAITQLAHGLGDGDGIVLLADDSFLATDWHGRLFHVSADGAVARLLDLSAQNVYMNDILLRGDTLLVPNLQPGSLTAYRVEH